MDTKKRLASAMAALVVACSALIGPAKAAIYVSVKPAVVPTVPGATDQFFEIVMTHDLPFDDIPFIGFNLTVTIGGAGVTIHQVDSATTDDYLLGTSGTGGVTLDSFPAASPVIVSLSDLVIVDPPNDFVPIDKNTPYGLARFKFSVAGGAGGFDLPITLSDGEFNVDLSDYEGLSFADLEVFPTDGAISVQSSEEANGIVAEPATMTLYLIGVAVLAGRGAYRRRRLPT